jgi:methylated-DNA-[protein]-cysteine S-methyltransferase
MIMNYEKQVTTFQESVLKVVLEIPFGQTRSYKWVADKIGKPKAARAVGQALRSNPYPVVYPCHRVIRLDGTLAGYAGGSGAPKKKLIKYEQEVLSRFKT